MPIRYRFELSDAMFNTCSEENSLLAREATFVLRNGTWAFSPSFWRPTYRVVKTVPRSPSSVGWPVVFCSITGHFSMLLNADIKTIIHEFVNRHLSSFSHFSLTQQLLLSADMKTIMWIRICRGIFFFFWNRCKRFVCTCVPACLFFFVTWQ